MQPIIDALADNIGLIIPLTVFGVGLVVVVVTVIGNTIRTISVEGQRERSRREIAAYVAEGSMSASEGKSLMDAGPRKSP